MRRWLKTFVGLLALSLLTPSVVLGQYESPSYKIDEYNIGSGGEIDASSDSYSLRGTIGDLATGGASSPSYDLFGGYAVTDDPYLEMVLTDSAIDLGTLSSSAVAGGTTGFAVSSNTGTGLSITVSGQTLTSSEGNTIEAAAGPVASQPGTGQFGLNLRDNDTPNVGADPSGSGDVDPTSDYNQRDRFQFQSGDTIATSDGLAGARAFTVSYIANIPATQPDGIYRTSLEFICVGVF